MYNTPGTYTADIPLLNTPFLGEIMDKRHHYLKGMYGNKQKYFYKPFNIHCLFINGQLFFVKVKLFQLNFIVITILHWILKT